MSDTVIAGTKAVSKNADNLLEMSCYVAGQKITSAHLLEVRSPYDRRLVGTVQLANATHVQQAIEAALKGGKKLNRYERYTILEKARQLLVERKEAFAKIISAESGLAMKEAIY